MSNRKMELGHTEDGLPVTLPVNAMLRHGVALGSSGSGKTVLCKVMAEEMVRNNVPVIAIDPQGDLASLGLCGDPAKLEQMGVAPNVAHEYHQKADVKIWTPGSRHGIPISIAPALATAGMERYEDKIRAWSSVADSLASLAGYSATSEVGECARVAFSAVLEYADTNRLLIENLNDFADFMRDPPLALLEIIDPIFSEGDRGKAERRFRIKTMGSNRLLFDLGKAIHVDSLFGYEEGGAWDQGKVRVSVVYLNTLNTFEEKSIFVAMLCNAMYQWMLKGASDKPVGLFYMDEVAPFMPPVRKPPSKPGLMMLLRQARKYGLCMLLATQSPGDLDYKGLSQVGTWALGKIATRQELAKVAPALRAEAGVDVSAIADSLPGFNAGQFALINSDHFTGPQEFQVRWLVSEHKCLSPDAVESLTDPTDREIYG